MNEIGVDNAISEIALVKQQKQSTIWEKHKHKKKGLNGRTNMTHFKGHRTTKM